MDKLIKKVYELFSENNSVLTEAGLSPIKTIDRYRGQTINPDQFEIYGIPAIFIGWNIKWNMVGKNYEGKASVDFHIVTDEPWGTSNTSTNHEDALKKAFFHKYVQKLLDGLESEETTKLVRNNDVPVDTGVICYNILTYTCDIYDTAGALDHIEINGLTLNITGKLKRKEDKLS